MAKNRKAAKITRWITPCSRVVRPAPDRRYALLNNQRTVHHLNGSTERRILTNAAEMREVLEGAFRLTLPDAPELDAVLERLTGQ